MKAAAPPPEFDDDDDTGLFRQAALAAQRPAQYGEIVLLPGANSRAAALLALAVVLAVVSLLALGSYTRRSTVAGHLAPAEGLIRITASQPGVVVERHAANGQQVRRGEVLFVLSGDRLGANATEYQRGIAAQVDARRQSLESDLRRLDLAEQQEAAMLERRAESLLSEQSQVGRQGQLLAQRLKGAADAQARYQGLYQQGYVSRDELLARDTELAEARARVQAQARDRLALEREHAAALRELDTLRSRYALQRAELQRAVLLASQEYAEIEARRRVVVTAPADGKLTLVQAEVGQSVDTGRALVQLVPQASPLVARLYAPSRAGGFVKPGDAVLLRYDAFPYQKFGQHVGKVLSVSTAAVAATELQGLNLAPEAAAEPLFAVLVALPQQTMVTAPGAPPLQTGMRVEADLMHETRRLYEWMLEPLYAARARLENG